MELQIQIEEQSNPIKEVLEAVSGLVGKLNLGQSAAKLAASATAAKRSLMSFDKLNRLTASSKSSKKSTVSQLLEALKNPNAVTGLSKPLSGLVNVLHGLGVELKFTDDKLFLLKSRLSRTPALLQQLTGSVLETVAGILKLPAATEQAENALNGVDSSAVFSAGRLELLSDAAFKAALGLEQGFSGTAAFFQNRVANPLQQIFSGMFTQLRPNADQAIAEVKDSFSQGAKAIENTFRSSWEQVLTIFGKTDTGVTSLANSVAGSLKNAVNRLISGINTAIIEPFTGLNSAFSRLKNLTIGDVQPFKNLNFSVNLPSIPLLASGAVLPANKPFLAMVGDQKHGTNVEAPLATIQQAVAQVMAENLEAEMAGHNATIGVLRQILEAVLGISLTEDALGSAVERYNARRSMMTGGF